MGSPPRAEAFARYGANAAFSVLPTGRCRPESKATPTARESANQRPRILPLRGPNRFGPSRSSTSARDRKRPTKRLPLAALLRRPRWYDESVRDRGSFGAMYPTEVRERFS